MLLIIEMQSLKQLHQGIFKELHQNSRESSYRVKSIKP